MRALLSRRRQGSSWPLLLFTISCMGVLAYARLEPDSLATHRSLRRELSSADSMSQPLFGFLLVPIFAALVGYGTNWLAIQMTFYPIEFGPIKLYQFPDQPFGFFGWQGIIPSKAGKMAGILTDLITSKLMDVRTVFNRVDPTVVATTMAPQIRETTARAVAAVALSEAPTIWNGLGADVRLTIRSLSPLGLFFFLPASQLAMDFGVMDRPLIALSLIVSHASRRSKRRPSTMPQGTRSSSSDRSCKSSGRGFSRSSTSSSCLSRGPRQTGNSSFACFRKSGPANSSATQGHPCFHPLQCRAHENIHKLPSAQLIVV